MCVHVHCYNINHYTVKKTEFEKVMDGPESELDLEGSRITTWQRDSPEALIPGELQEECRHNLDIRFYLVL